MIQKVILSFTLVLALIFPYGLKSQQLYYVHFIDKPTDAACYAEDITLRAIERRVRQDVPFPQWADLPVNADYVSAITNEVNSLRYVLRWMNAVTVSATEAQIYQIKRFEFVRSVEPFTGNLLPCDFSLKGASKNYSDEACEFSDSEVDPSSMRKLENSCNEVSGVFSGALKQDTAELGKLLRLQRSQLNLDTLAAHGLSGKGVRIAILDAGFMDFDTHPAFSHVFKGNQLIAQKDFYGGNENVYYHSIHGTAVASAIVGMTETGPIGAAWNSELLLARTEHLHKEKVNEEDHWFAAMEWADAQGADIISSSLGYGRKRYEKEELDGYHARVSQAARTASGLGILVVASIGNEGASKRPWLSAPADVETVLSVGASYPMIRYPMPFTSHGPNAAGVLKPDVSAPGFVFTAGKNGEFMTSGGTSFSCPLISGMAACLFEHSPKADNAYVIRRLREAGHFYPYYDYLMGCGVPDAKYLFHPRDTVESTFSARVTKDSIFIRVYPHAIKHDPKDKNGQPFYMHIAAADGKLVYQTRFRLQPDKRAFTIPINGPLKGVMLRAWFEGYLWERKIENGE